MRPMAGRKNSKLLHAAREEAARQSAGVKLDMDPIDALQECLDGAVSMLRWAGVKAAKVPDDKVMVMTAFGPIPNQYVRLEQDMRKEVAGLAARMVDLDIADRSVRLQEAKAMLIVQAIQAAARKAGIPRDQIKLLGPALRDELLTIEGTAREPVAA